MITSVRLENFKNFADETLRLGPFTVIVGANASGKSNIRDAFRFLHGIGRDHTLPEIFGGRYGAGGQIAWEPIRGADNEIVRFGQTEFTLESEIDLSALPREEIAIDSTRMSYAVRIGRDSSGRRGFSILGEILRADTGHSWKRPESWKRQDGLKDECLTNAYFGEEDSQSLYLRLAIRDEFRSMNFLDPVPNLMRQPSSPGQIFLGEGGENLTSVLREICLDKKVKGVLIEWIRELTPMDVVDLRFLPDPSGRIHLMIREEGGRKVSAYSASDGTLRFLAMLAALFTPKSTLTSLYFIEEIDNGLHPSRLHLLLDLIETQTAETGIQVVATTHSPTLLSMMSDRTFEDASVVCRLPDSADSIIRPVSEIPKAAKLRKSQGLGRLLVGGWMENVLAFTEGDDAEGAG